MIRRPPRSTLFPYTDALPIYPVKAKALLKEAGYPQGFELTVYLYTLPGLPEQVDIGHALALDWQAVGLKPKLVRSEEHTSELQPPRKLVCRLLLENKTRRRPP